MPNSNRSHKQADTYIRGYTPRLCSVQGVWESIKRFKIKILRGQVVLLKKQRPLEKGKHVIFTKIEKLNFCTLL